MISTARRSGTAFFILLIFLQPALLVPSSVPPFKRQKWVALTFDDGPWPQPTWKIQKILRSNGIPATFFIVGKVAARFPNVVRALSRDGNEIANHSWSHPDIEKIQPSQMRVEFQKTRDLIRTLTGQDTDLVRTPGSTRHYILKRFHVPKGYRLVLWDVHAMDHRPSVGNAICERVLRDIRPGSIVLLHNGRQETVDALRRLIPELKKRNYHFATVSQLMERYPASHNSVIDG